MRPLRGVGAREVQVTRGAALPYAAASLAIVAAVSLVYGSVLWTDYLFSDDYKMFFGELTPGSRVWLSGGRPLYGLMMYGVDGFVSSVSDVRLVRLIAVVAIGGVGMVVLAVLRSYGISWWRSVPVAVLSGFLLPFQENAAYATEFVHPIASTLAAAGGALTLLGHEGRRESMSRSGMRKQLGWVGATLFLTALLIYQPSGMVFWSMGGAYVTLCRDKRSGWLSRVFVPYLLTGLSAMVVYYVVYKSILIASGVAMQSRGAFVGLDELPSKVGYLLGVVKTCSGLFLLHEESKATAALRGCVLILAAIGAWGLGRSAEKPNDRIWRVLCCVLLLPLTLAPNLVVAKDIYPLRTFVGVAMLLLIAASAGYFALLDRLESGSGRWRRAGSLGGAIILVFAGYNAGSTVTNGLVFPQAMEFRYMVSRLVNADMSRVRHVHIVRPSDRGDGIAERIYANPGGVFGTTSAGREWVTVRMMRRALDLVDEGRIGRIAITHSDPGQESLIEYLESRADSLVVDMSRLASFRLLRGGRPDPDGGTQSVDVPGNDANGSADFFLLEGFDGMRVTADRAALLSFAREKGRYALRLEMHLGRGREPPTITVNEDLVNVLIVPETKPWSFSAHMPVDLEAGANLVELFFGTKAHAPVSGEPEDAVRANVKRIELAPERIDTSGG